MDHVEQRLGREPARQRRAHTVICELRILVRNLHRFSAPALGRGVGHELRMAAFLKRHEPKHSFLNRATHGKQAVVDQQGGLFIADAVGNVYAFLGRENDAVEGLVQDMVLRRALDGALVG